MTLAERACMLDTSDRLFTRFIDIAVLHVHIATAYK